MYSFQVDAVREAVLPSKVTSIGSYHVWVDRIDESLDEVLSRVVSSLHLGDGSGGDYSPNYSGWCWRCWRRTNWEYYTSEVYGRSWWTASRCQRCLRTKIEYLYGI